MTAPASPPPGTADALAAAGFERHKRGDLAGAVTLYRQALACDPEHPDALHLSGLAARAEGRHDEALALIARAVRRLPGNPDFQANLASAHLTAGDAAAALTAAERACALAPASASAHARRAAALAALGRTDEAAAAYGRALDLDPRAPDAINNFANLEQRRGNLDAAIALYERALAAAPGEARFHSNYGTAIYALFRAGRTQEAADRARRWRAAHPDNATARHWAAALARDGNPPRAEDGYVRDAFDIFAATFDATLASVGYSVPAAIGEMFAARWGAPTPRWRILDAGCGTGLAGLVVRGWATRLEGVDLSPGMLERARARGIYDELRAGELMADVAARPGRYDFVVAADVFCYFGEIDPALRAAHAALAPGGHLLLSTETLAPGESGDWAVRPSGRYAHARAYVERAVAAAGFEALEYRIESPRAEDGRDLPGIVALLRRAGP